MPSIDDLFGPEKRSGDDLFAPEPPKVNNYVGDVADYTFNHDSLGRLMSAFGQGAKEGYGDGSGIGATKAVAGNQNYVEGQKDWGAIHKTVSKSLNENFLRPAALAADTAFTALSMGFAGSIKAAKEASNILLENSQDKTPSMFPGGKVLEGMAGEAIGLTTPSVDTYTNPYTGETQTSGMWAMLPDNMHPLSKSFVDRAVSARAKGIIGEGEEGYFNTVPLSPEALAARQAASKESGTPVVIKPPETMPTKVARMIDPETFNELDRLHDLQENLRNSRESLRAQVKTPDDPQYLYKDQQRIQKQLDELQQPLVDVDIALRDSLDTVKEVRERATDTMEMEGPEGDAFRDYIQTKLLEQELGIEADIALEHAKSLMPEKSPVERAKEDLKVVNKDLGIGTEGKPEPSKSNTTAASKASPEVTKYVDDYLAGKGRGNTPEDLEMQQFAANHSAEIEKEFERRKGQPVDEVVIGTPSYTQQATVGTGESKPYGLSRGVEERARAYGLVDDLGQLPERKAAELKKLEMDAERLVSQDYTRAKRIAMGHEEAPEGIHPLAVLNAVEDRAHLERDVNLIRDLAHSELKARVSEAGLDLRLQREKNIMDTNAADRLKEIIDFRKRRNEKALTTEGFEMGEALKTYMEKAESSVDDAISYIRSLECDY